MLTALMLLAILQPVDHPIELAPAPMTGTDDWRHIASSATRAYFVNTGRRTVDGQVTRVVAASVPLAARAGQSHLRDHYEIRCAAGDYRVVRSVDVAEDGDEDAFDDTEAAWDSVPDDGLIDGIKRLACGESQVADGYPSLAAFMTSRD